MRLILMLLGLVALGGCDRQKAEDQQGAQPAAPAPAAQPAAGPVKGVDRSRTGKALPDTAFLGDDGEETSLDEFRGTPVLVNLWATWCAPCIKELPTLQQAAASKGDALRFVPISQDSAAQSTVAAFLDYHKLDLPAYQDPDMSLSAALGAEVLPTTILFDSRGREIWRFVGDLDWTSAEGERLIAEAR